MIHDDGIIKNEYKETNFPHFEGIIISFMPITVSGICVITSVRIYPYANGNVNL